MSTYTLWVKEGQAMKRPNSKPGDVDFAFAYDLRGPGLEKSVCEDRMRPSPPLTGLVVLLSEVIPTLPEGITLHVVTGQDSFVGALDERQWLEKWRRERFVGRPHWAKLDGMLTERGVTITAKLSKVTDDDEDRDILRGLAKHIDHAHPGTKPKPKKRQKWTQGDREFQAWKDRGRDP